MKSIQETLIRLVCKKGSYYRPFARSHPYATEEIILIAKAMDFLESL
jgi:hypothetical protein